MPGDQDFCADLVFPRNGKGDLITYRNTRAKKAGQQQPGLIAQHADSCVLLQFNVRYTPTTDWVCRNGGYRTHIARAL